MSSLNMPQSSETLSGEDVFPGFTPDLQIIRNRPGPLDKPGVFLQYQKKQKLKENP